MYMQMKYTPQNICEHAYSVLYALVPAVSNKQALFCHLNTCQYCRILAVPIIPVQTT